MRIRIAIAAVVAGLMLPNLAWSDGLIYKLPDDGASVTYEMKVKAGPNGNEVEQTATLRISSVGVELVGNDKCRWIEIRLSLERNGQEQIVLSKALIPEKHIGKGKSPGENLVRAWIKMGAQDVVELKDLSQPQAGALSAFLRGPSATAKKLDPITVENDKLGKQECAGEQADYEFDQGANHIELSFEHRLSDKAPFGVLASKMNFTTKRDGNIVEKGEATFKLTDVGTSALTELPNNK